MIGAVGPLGPRCWRGLRSGHFCSGRVVSGRGRSGEKRAVASRAGRCSPAAACGPLFRAARDAADFCWSSRFFLAAAPGVRSGPTPHAETCRWSSLLRFVAGGLDSPALPALSRRVRAPAGRLPPGVLPGPRLVLRGGCTVAILDLTNGQRGAYLMPLMAQSNRRGNVFHDGCDARWDGGWSACEFTVRLAR